MRTETDPVTGTPAGAAPLGRRSVATRPQGRSRFKADRLRTRRSWPSRMRRQFTAEYRLRIVEEADRCTRPGEVGRASSP